ncbi:P-loop containing nucleoside triphosphate hydrolase protein [Penicillium hispanicum]|uniref:P-loop containing nucleoside triphosphate hydrolase protein n=1 Tax=Penicillium hispanicum TaxID=1080232 RepID=UPI002540358D|nr:P-loop containing nucleoside triphosphate hydrolase protein [Penicillium hispanicum]KAJ5591975.1 P-loop containing nucleoside triphosphate hydrolase protein [Penicillium hispanicum]
MSLFSKPLVRRSKPASSTQAPTPGPPKNFRAGRAPGPNDVFIAVMGVTGSGKSSFISLCSGKPVQIGHDLKACTSVVDVYAYDALPNRTVYLIDTPGFDDTKKSDTEVLSEIAAWLGDSYRNNILLNGIIYLHRITDIRMQGSARKNLIMFKELCGQDALKKVILVTTMWDRISSEEGQKREKELTDTPEFWGWMLSKGSTCHRHHNTEGSAKKVVHLLASHNAPIATELQKQLIDEKRSLDQTSAGRELQSEILKEKRKWARERREIEDNMKAAIQKRDRETEEMMREERDRYTRMIQKAESDTGALRSTMESLLAQRDKRVARMEKQMQKQQDAHLAELRQIKERQQRLEREKAKLEQERLKEKQEREKEKEAREQQARLLREREKELKRERERARERQVQKPPSRQAQSRFVPATTTSVSTATVIVPYSVALCGNLFACIGPNYTSSNTGNPKMQQGSARIVSVSLGDAIDGSTTWVARYSDGSWLQSKGLDRQYPHLGGKISAKGLNGLELCVLGPGQRYYARWTDGSWGAWASDETNAELETYGNLSDGSKIMDVAFGYGDSFVVSYGHSTNMKQLGNRWNLKGYYQDLYDFIEANSPISIAAIALDPMSTTDYILVWTGHHGDGLYRLRWLCSYSNTSQSINNWWSAG